MDRMLYVAMSGAKNAMQAQATNSHNLANANTVGFKADLDVFADKHVYGPGHPTRAYTQDERAGTDFNAGSLMTTGRGMDVAIKGQGWLAVQGPDGGEAYTRAGDLRVNSAGVLTNGAGRVVLGEGGPIAIPPAEKVDIAADGTISIVPAGEGPQNVAALDRIKLVNPPTDQLEKGKDGLFRLANEEQAEADAGVQLVSGALESSNVNPVDAMVKMIEYSRMFETQSKMLKTADENDSASNRLLRMG